LELGESGENQIRLEVPLIRVPPEETPIGSDSGPPLMDVDSEVVSVSGMLDVANPTSADGRDSNTPPSVVSPAQPPDGPTELPNAKKRRVMFADE
jgi:hypothetical protein